MLAVFPSTESNAIHLEILSSRPRVRRIRDQIKAIAPSMAN